LRTEYGTAGPFQRHLKHSELINEPGHDMRGDELFTRHGQANKSPAAVLILPRRSLSLPWLVRTGHEKNAPPTAK
jgi:hypothetical protein